MKKILLSLFLSLFLFSFVSAIDYYPSNIETNLTISCENINCSDGNIYISILDANNDLVVDNQSTTKEAGYFYYSISATNLSTEGVYKYYLTSDNDYYSSSFIITESGVEITEGRSNLAVILLGVLVLFLFISLYSLFNIENYMGKFTLYWISHLLIVLIFFIGWQFGVEGLLSGTALVGIFRVLFFFTIIAVFPMIILSMTWIFYIHTMNEHIKKLIEKGEDPETAFAIAKRNKGRQKY